MNQSITVCTCTVGDSALHLGTLLRDLRRFTKIPFRQIVVDDGTLSDQSRSSQWSICNRYGAEWMENLGPTYGCSFAWNRCLDAVETPWAFCLEDGLRPSMSWLETALDFIDKIGNRTWIGHKVGMAGMASIQDWMLALGAVWEEPGVMEVFHRSEASYRAFYGDWNDGYWCWQRLLPGMMRACRGDTSTWTNDVEQFRVLAVEGIQALRDLHPLDVDQAWQKWRTTDHWPQKRTAFCGWYPGAFMLVNMDAWRRVGRFRDGCTFFEGHLGTRMGMHGYLSLCVEFPPFLHTPSLGFTAGPGQGKSPRLHLDTADVFKADFMGLSNMDAPNVLASAVVPIDKQIAINSELAKVELWMDEGWGRYLT